MLNIKKYVNCCIKCTYVCMYVCIHVCMYICMYTCMYVCMYVCTYVCMYVCMYVCILVRYCTQCPGGLSRYSGQGHLWQQQLNFEVSFVDQTIHTSMLDRTALNLSRLGAVFTQSGSRFHSGIVRG